MNGCKTWRNTYMAYIWCWWGIAKRGELPRTPSRRSSENSPSRNCLKSLASLKTNASKPTKQSKEDSFRCDMTAISALETLLSDFLDNFRTEILGSSHAASRIPVAAQGPKGRREALTWCIQGIQQAVTCMILRRDEWNTDPVTEPHATRYPFAL